MTEQINWDPSIVKKFGTSNHLKLINQLRSEVKKYPLNRKKNLSTNGNIEVINKSKASYYSNNQKQNTTEITYENNKNQDDSSNTINNFNNHSQTKITNNQNDSFYLNSQKERQLSNVSFNNSKDFNIYNNKIKQDKTLSKKDVEVAEDKNNKENTNNSLTFKDRLDQIDMK